MKATIINKLKESISPSSSSLCQACRDIWTFISSTAQGEQADYLKAFLTDFKSADDFLKNPPDSFFEIEWRSAQSEEELTNLENRIVSNLIDARVTEPAFYSELCTKLNDETLFKNVEDKANFLALLWRDVRIPYFKLDEGRIMDNEQYGALISKIREPLDKAFFILNAKLNYKTQRSSLLLEVANSLEDEDERIVFWAVLLDIQNKQIQELYKRLETLVQESEQNVDKDSAN